MSDLYGVIGTSEYNNLLADPQGADEDAVVQHPEGRRDAGYPGVHLQPPLQGS